MIDLGSTEFYIPAHGLPPAEFEAYCSRLFDLWEARVAEELSLDDYSLILEIEEGSVKGSGKIKTALKTVFLVVCGYGSLVQGLQSIRSHVSIVGDYLSEMARSSLGEGQPDPTVRKRTGTIGQIERLFLKVQRREMTCEDAIAEAKAILGDEAAQSPEFMDRLADALRVTQLHSEQIELALEGLEVPASEPSKKDRSPRTPRPSPAIPPSNPLRVEVWKESKRGKKKIKVTSL